MAGLDRGARWRGAALGGALVALGAALFGAARRGSGPVPGGGPKPGSRPRPDAGRPEGAVPDTPEAVQRTRYWPPPPPKPLDAYDDGIRPPEQAVQNAHLPVDRESEKRGYEAGDADAGKVVKVMLSSALVVAGCIAGLFALVGWQHGADRQAPPLTEQQLAVIVPPGPRLQDHPLHDIATENQRETDLLRYYAWSGPDHRSGRIPIERAQALVIGRPLDPSPAADPAPAPASNP